MCRIKWLTKYDESGASSRLRAYALKPGLEERGWGVDISPLQAGPGSRGMGGVVQGMVKRVGEIVANDGSNLVVVQKDVLPPSRTTHAVCRGLLRRIRYVWDVDDAVWANGPTREGMARAHARGAEGVVAGNEVLARWVRDCGQENVWVVPTCTYVPEEVPDGRRGDQLCIGWIGSPQSERFLEGIADVLLELSHEFSFEFKVMGGRLPRKLHQCSWAEELSWDREREGDFLSRLDIGIGPLTEDGFARGRSGFKLIQYMSRGVSVIAQDNEVHRSLLEDGACGVLVKDRAEWYQALEWLLGDANARRRFGARGHERARLSYSTDVAAREWDAVLRELGGRSVRDGA